MEGSIKQILENAGWRPSEEFGEIVHYHNCAHCGEPTEAGDNDTEMVRVARALIRYGAKFSVEAKGDSMIDAGISDGDILMIRQQNVAESGDIVLVIVNGDQVMVKNYIVDEDDAVWFVPSNDKYPALCAEDYPDAIIVGKVVCIEHPCPRSSYRDCMKRIRKHESAGETRPCHLNKAIRSVSVEIQGNRLWYAVFRAMVDENLICDGDYESFNTKIKEALGEGAPDLNLKDIRSMAQLSFNKPIDLWNPQNAPVQGKRFHKYQEIGRAFKRALRKL